MSKKGDGMMPVYKCRIGSLQTAVWENERQTENGMRTFRTISLKRSYRDSDGEWQETSQLNAEDLGNAIKLLENALNYCMRDE